MSAACTVSLLTRHAVLLVVVLILGSASCARDRPNPAGGASDSSEPEKGSTTSSPPPTTKIGLVETDTSRAGTPAAPGSKIRRGCHPGELPRRFHARVRCESYVVRGASRAQLARQVGRGVLDPNDDTFVAALTNWYVAWNYRFSSSAAGCEIASPSVSVRFGFVVPEWKAPKERSADVVEEWNRFFAALWRHERGHVRLALGAAREIERFLAALGAASDCNTLEARANLGGQRVLRKVRARQRAYDETTVHGQTEGAVLMP